jgi:AcrR family transcriptional regulator
MPTAPATEVRARILGAMAALVAEKGYAAVTIDDLARGARISKRTFYDHFADKHACFLAAYDAAAAAVYDVVEQAASAPAASWRARVDAVIATYLKALAARPEMTRVFHVEILAAGPEALDRHLAVNLRYGAVHELVLHAVAEGRTRSLPSRAGTVRPLIDAALAG